MLLARVEFLLGDVPEGGVMQELGAVVPVFGAPEVDLSHTGGFSILEPILEAFGIERLVLLVKAGLLDGLAVRRPGLGLQLVYDHVLAGDDLLQTS